MSHAGHAHGTGEPCSSTHAGHSHGSNVAPVAASTSSAASVLSASREPGASLWVDWQHASSLAAHLLEGAPPAAGSGCDAGAENPACHGPGAWDAALSAVLRVAATARRSGLFSVGEALADVPTRNLPYLLADFTAAQLRQRSPGSAAERARALRTARGELEGFVARALSLRGLVPRDEALAVGLFAALPHLAEDAADGAGSARADVGAARVRDSGAARAAKIERYKRTRVAEARRKALVAADADALEAARRRGLGDAEAEARAELDGVGAPAAAAGAVDEETRREITVLLLQCAVRTALDDLAAIEQELPLLAHAQSLAEAEVDAAFAAGRLPPVDKRTAAGAAAAASAHSERGVAGADFSGRTGPPADDPSVDPARPGLQVQRIDRSFNVERETVRADVFRDPHPAPTMSMEEWGDIVTAKRLVREERERGQADLAGKSLETIRDEGLEAGGVSEADFDRATERKRRMDDWKDGVPKGAGNTKRI